MPIAKLSTCNHGANLKKKFFAKFFKKIRQITACDVLKLTVMIHYLENKVGVVDFANAQGLVMF